MFYLFIRAFIYKLLYQHCDHINYLRFIETEDVIYLLSCVVRQIDFQKGIFFYDSCFFLRIVNSVLVWFNSTLQESNKNDNKLQT